jgi:hypothetical protein
MPSVRSWIRTPCSAANARHLGQPRLFPQSQHQNLKHRCYSRRKGTMTRASQTSSSTSSSSSHCLPNYWSCDSPGSSAEGDIQSLSSLARSTHRHAVATVVVLDRVHKVTHHQQSSTAGANSVFIGRRISHRRAIETSPFIFDFDEDVVAQKPVANSDRPARVPVVAVSNCVDHCFVQAMSERERFLMGNTPRLDTRYKFVNFTTSIRHVIWDTDFPETVALHG